MDQTVEDALTKHYSREDLITVIKKAIQAIGKTPATVSVDDLSSMDEFHVGGRDATKMLMDSLELKVHHHLLDVGCGLGGPARFIADKYGSSITGIDLTPEFVDVGNKINCWFGLENQVNLREGNIMNLSALADQFDGAYMIHVGMNVEDKISLFKEIAKSIKRDGFFVVFDLMQIDSGGLTFPVPWSATQATSFLVSSGAYQYALEHSGFKIELVRNHHAFAIDFYQRVQEQNRTQGLSPMGLHLLMGDDTKTRLTNAYSAILDGVIAPIQIVARKI